MNEITSEFGGAKQKQQLKIREGMYTVSELKSLGIKVKFGEQVNTFNTKKVIPVEFSGILKASTFGYELNKIKDLIASYISTTYRDLLKESLYIEYMLYKFDPSKFRITVYGSKDITEDEMSSVTDKSLISILLKWQWTDLREDLTVELNRFEKLKFKPNEPNLSTPLFINEINVRKLFGKTLVLIPNTLSKDVCNQVNIESITETGEYNLLSTTSDCFGFKIGNYNLDYRFESARTGLKSEEQILKVRVYMQAGWKTDNYYEYDVKYSKELDLNWV